ncbi:hypothetical protein [Tenacibaculum agarivorans]|uniref:hypothetical protein n=1 Tax=Tenacibaculum agarivorans TaxID=1908389 RepID=UPI00094BC508|nr:hypothetical protein [Tenacibaculum agarivorans]
MIKQLIYILILVSGILECNNQPQQIKKSITTNSNIQSQRIDNSKYYTQLDTIVIITEHRDTLKYTKTDFNNIIDTHPEFFNEYPSEPDLTYYCENKDEKYVLGEVGRDSYYVLYAHFLKQKNGIEEFTSLRKRLINIYLKINSLFAQLCGGTYYGHQYYRILGYVEYSIYIQSRKSKESSENTYNITKQKELYVQSLRQLIEDQIKSDRNKLEYEKIERIKKLNKIVNQLENLITDIFYLRQAQEFQYNHYRNY